MITFINRDGNSMMNNNQSINIDTYRCHFFIYILYLLFLILLLITITITITITINFDNDDEKGG